MMTAIVIAIAVVVVLLIGAWLISPAFRAWTEKPKYAMLEREAMFERAVASAQKDMRPGKKTNDAMRADRR